MYNHGTYIRYYSIKPIGDANLTKLNMFKVDKAIHYLIGPCMKISEDYKSKSWTVEIKNEEQGTKLMKMTELLMEPVTVCLLYTSPSPRDKRQSRMPSSA